MRKGALERGEGFNLANLWHVCPQTLYANWNQKCDAETVCREMSATSVSGPILEQLSALTNLTFLYVPF